MGMYTKINIILPIKNDTSNDIKEILQSMFEGDDIEDMKRKQLKLPSHKFFEGNRRIWFPASGGSYYFTGTVNSNIKYTSDAGDNQMVLHIDTDFKNYDDEIELFLDWIQPYVDAGQNEFLGYSRYEETFNPTLYFFKDKKIVSFVNNNVEENW